MVRVCICFNRIHNSLDKIKKLNTFLHLVVFDINIDRFWYGNIIGRSVESRYVSLYHNKTNVMLLCIYVYNLLGSYKR